MDLKFLAIRKDAVMVGISEIDFLNQEITNEIYSNAPSELTLCPVDENIDKDAILADGFKILIWNI